MPNPLTTIFSDPESDNQGSSGSTPKGFGTLEEKVKPKGEGFADPIDQDSQPESSGTPPKAGRDEPVKPKGKS